MQKGRAGPVDADDEDRPRDLLPRDLGVQLPFAGRAPRVVRAEDRVSP